MQKCFWFFEKPFWKHQKEKTLKRRLPNFLTVDLVSIGDARKLVIEINNCEPEKNFYEKGAPPLFDLLDLQMANKSGTFVNLLNNFNLFRK